MPEQVSAGSRIVIGIDETTCYIRYEMQSPDQLSDERRRKARVGSIWLFVFCVLLLSSAASAQQAPYSADSLMAAFKKGSQVSLKGTEITFTGVIAEIKKSRVIFKSSENDKVICELVSSIGGANAEHPVGSHFTVVGKVKGRGMLGNVTLDQCSPVLSNIVTSEPPSPEPSGGTEEPKEQADVQAIPSPETEIAAPVAARTVSAHPISPTTLSPAPTTRDDVESPEDAVPTELDSDLVAKIFEPKNVRVEEESIAAKPASRRLFPAFVVVLVGLGALLAFIKFRPAVAEGSRTPTGPTLGETRRAAFERLLMEAKKKK